MSGFHEILLVAAILLDILAGLFGARNERIGIIG